MRSARFRDMNDKFGRSYNSGQEAQCFFCFVFYLCNITLLSAEKVAAWLVGILGCSSKPLSPIHRPPSILGQSSLYPLPPLLMQANTLPLPDAAITIFHPHVSLSRNSFRPSCFHSHKLTLSFCSSASDLSIQRLPSLAWPLLLRGGRKLCVCLATWPTRSKV